MLEDIARIPGSPASGLEVTVLALLIYLLGQAYRDLVDEHPGSGRLPSVRTEASTWRRWLGLVGPFDLGDPDRVAEEAL